jgi:hypothetical protein
LPTLAVAFKASKAENEGSTEGCAAVPVQLSFVPPTEVLAMVPKPKEGAEVPASQTAELDVISPKPEAEELAVLPVLED